MTADRKLAIATAPNPDSKRWPQHAPVTWAGLVDWLDLSSPADTKECGGYVLGELEANRRRKDTVLTRSALALDADYASASFVADSAMDLGCAVAFYTTWRHTPENPRWRLLSPLSRDVDPGEYRLIAQAVMVELGAEQFDTGSSQPERFMYRPSTQGHYEHHIIPGDLLDADVWLARAKEFGIEDEPDHNAYVYDGPDRRAAEGIHPYAARAIADELARLSELAPPWAEGDGWDATTFAVACNLIEFANSGWSGYSLRQAYDDLLEHAPADYEWGRTQHNAKWLSARNKVREGGRPEPLDERGNPEDYFDPVSSDVSATERPTATFAPMDLGALLNPNRPPREYVLDPMLAVGTSVAFVAPAGHRKSLLALNIALAVARGDSEFANMRIPRARRVLYIDMENTEDDLSERLTSFGVTPEEDLSRFLLVSLPPMEPLDTAKGGAALVAAVDGFGLIPGDLVVLDSYQRVTEAGENDSDTTRGYYRHTGVRLKSRGLTVIRTDNTGKDASKGARGSSGKRDDVDVEYLIQSNGDYINITVGKARQRGLTEMSLHVSTEDGRTRFRSDLVSPTTSRVQECIELLDRLAVPDETGERKVYALIAEAGEASPARAILREALKERKASTADAHREFSE